MLPPADNGMDALLGSISSPMYVIDLRALPEAGPLADWMQQEHDFRIVDQLRPFAPARMFDAILYVDRLTSAIEQPRREQVTVTVPGVTPRLVEPPGKSAAPAVRP